MMSATLPLTDPGDGRYLLAAVSWVRTLVTGSLATLVAILAVAAVGYLLLQGRVLIRRMGSVVIGCFIIFGSASLADSLMTLAGSSNSLVPTRSTPPPPPVVAAPPQPTVYDPYAGASVPVR